MDMGLEGLEAAEDMGAAEEGRRWMAPEGEGQGRSCTAGGGRDKEQWPYMHLEPTDRWGAGTQRAAGGEEQRAVVQEDGHGPPAGSGQHTQHASFMLELSLHVLRAEDWVGWQ